MARPTKLTPELTRQITSYIQKGNTPTISATLAGISHSTYFDWMRKGSNGEPGFLEFSESIKRATAQSVVLRILEITTAEKKGSWRAAAWMLERLAPESFGKQITKSHDVDPCKPKVPYIATLQNLEEILEKAWKIKLSNKVMPQVTNSTKSINEGRGI